MPVERKPFSVTRQMIMVIFPILDLWATYRIQKLRWYLLIFLLGFGIFWIAVDWAMYGEMFWDEDANIFAEKSSTIIFILEVAIQIIVAMIVIRKWTIEWNSKIETK
jgi:hypothetical protein